MTMTRSESMSNKIRTRIKQEQPIIKELNFKLIIAFSFKSAISKRNVFPDKETKRKKEAWRKEEKKGKRVS